MLGSISGGRRRGATMGAIVAVLLASVASGQFWDETIDGGGDAGSLPSSAQITIGTGPLTQITGFLEQGEAVADMYCISIPDPGAFTASYFNSNPGESGQLWLFDSAGNGVAHGSDDTAPYSTAILPGLVTSPGVYFLAISRLGVVPTDGGGGAVFPFISSGQTGPNIAAGPVAGWSVSPTGSIPGPYRIILEGAGYHDDGTGGHGGSQPDGGPCWTYTLEDHFNYGNLFNLEVISDPATGEACLRLVDEPKAWPFLAVANSNRGTLMRIAVEDIPSLGISEGDVLGEYKTAPFGMLDDPSRTTVDGFGNVWVGNRRELGSSGGQFKGSVTRVGLVLGGTRVDALGNPDATGDYLMGPFEYCSCEDRDGDGLIKTSRGYPRTTGLPNADYANTILPWPNTAGADSDGGVSTAEDECITAYYRTVPTVVRHVSIDANNDVWVGGTGNRRFEHIDGALVSQLTFFQSECGGYGGLVDPDGILWSAQWGPNNLMRYDPVSTARQCLNIPNYGMGLDTDCTTNPGNFSVWTSLANDGNAREISPAGVLLNTYGHGSSATPRGLVVKSGSVWVAHSGTNNVGRLTTGGTFLGNVTMFEPGFGVTGNSPHGVAADTNGKIWAVNRSTNNAMRIDPTIGVAGQVDLAVDLGSGAFPYNYSDMTGDLYMSMNPQGTWTFVHDGGKPGCEWGNISWFEQIIGNASITVRIRASDSPVPSGPWTVISNGVDFTATGRYIQVQVTMSRQVIDCIPDGEALLCELTICKAADCFVEIDDVECGLDDPGALIITGTVTNNSGADATHILLTPIPIGSGMTFTPNIIPVNIPDGTSGTFTTTVTGWTDGVEFCFLVTLLDETFDVCCTTEVCITPDCECLQVRDRTVRVECDPITGDYTVTLEVDNLTNDIVYHMFLFAPSGVTFTPNYFAFPGSVPPNTSTGPISFVVSGASEGPLCFEISLHDAALFECCGREVCIELPKCIIRPGGGTDGTGAPRLGGAPWVHLDAGLAAACGPDAQGVLTIINNGDTPAAFQWVINPSLAACDLALPDGAVVPSAGMTDVLEPGKCVDVHLTIDTTHVPVDSIACMEAIIVDPETGFATSTYGQVIAPRVLDDAQPAVMLSACPVDQGSVVGLPIGGKRSISFDVFADIPGTGIEYTIVSSNPFLSLNGGEPGEAVEGVVVLDGSPATNRLTVSAMLVSSPGTRILDVALFARTVGDYRPTGPQPLGAVSVRDSAMERCAGDFNGDGVVDLRDINDFISAFLGQEPEADFDNNGVFDLQDVNLFVAFFTSGC